MTDEATSKCQDAYHGAVDRHSACRFAQADVASLGGCGEIGENGDENEDRVAANQHAESEDEGEPLAKRVAISVVRRRPSR